MCTYSEFLRCLRLTRYLIEIGGTAGGAESITQCSNHDNNWCCNGDATNVNCCQESPAPRPFFALQDGNAYATIGTSTASAIRTLSGITGLATSASGTGISTTSRSSSTSAGSRSNTATATVNSVSTTASAFTSVVQSVTSGSAGVATIYITSVVTPTAASTADSSSGGGSSNLGLIVGCAVGIPLGLALIGIVFWMLRKRRNQKANPYELDGDSPNSSGIAGGAAAAKAKKEQFRHSRPGTAEIDGNPVGVGRPVSTVTGHAELAAGQGFQPGHGTPYAPDTVGLGGGSTAGRDSLGSQPPQYSPPATQTGFNHSNAVEMDGTSAMPAINEKAEYQAYKLPDGVAELPSVKTPPEDVEKQLTK